MAGNAAIYVRVSSLHQEQDGTSLETQEEACRRYAADHGFIVHPDHVYRETHTGADLWERPKLVALMETMKAGEIAALIAFSVDRLSREQGHIYIVDDIASRSGVDLLFATEEFDKTPVGKIIRSVKGFAAELERQKIRERTMIGQRRRVEKGLLPGKCPAPFGYRYADERRASLVPDPDTAPIVRELFARVEAGASLSRMAREFTGRGIPTPRRSSQGWSISSLSNILANPAYMGQAIAFKTEKRKDDKTRKVVTRDIPDSERVTLPEGTIPALVSESTFATVRVKLARNKMEAKRRLGEPETFLLRAGFVVCGHCGKTMTAGWNPYGHDRSKKYAVYRAHADRHRNCAADRASFATAAAKLDAKVWAAVRERLLNRDLLEAEIAAQLAADQVGPVAERLAGVERLIADTGRQQANVTATIAQVDDREVRGMLLAQLTQLAERKRGLEAERTRLATQREALEADRARVRSLLDYCRDAEGNVDEFTYAERRDALALFGIRALVWGDGRIKIEPRIDPLRDIVSTRSCWP